MLVVDIHMVDTVVAVDMVAAVDIQPVGIVADILQVVAVDNKAAAECRTAVASAFADVETSVVLAPHTAVALEVLEVVQTSVVAQVPKALLPQRQFEQLAPELRSNRCSFHQLAC